MTTTTVVETAEEQRTWTLAEVAKQEAKAAEIAETRDETRRRVEELDESVADALAAGEDERARALATERADLRELLDDLDRALPVLAERIAERRDAACENAGEKRLLAIARAHGSARVSYEQDVDRVVKTGKAFVAAIEKLNARYATMQGSETEAIVLRNRFPDLDPPAITRVLSPAHQSKAAEALKRVRAARLADPPAVPHDLTDVLPRAASGLVARIEGTPTGEILKEAGGFDEAAHQYGKAASDRTRTRDAERRAERDRVDEWLAGVLKGGPVPIDEVKRAAAAEGVPLRSDPNAFGASLPEAVERLRVFAVVAEDDRNGPQHWTLARAEGYPRAPGQMAMVR